MAALGVDAAVFQDQNAVRFTHGGHPLGDYHQGSAGEIPPQRLPQRGLFSQQRLLRAAAFRVVHL